MAYAIIMALLFSFWMFSWWQAGKDLHSVWTLIAYGMSFIVLAVGILGGIILLTARTYP